jgi:hypothetical protein
MDIRQKEGFNLDAFIERTIIDHGQIVCFWIEKQD